MTALKYLLLIILGWMISGWSAPMWAKTDTAADTSSDTANTASTDAGTDQSAATHKTSHRRKHKSSKKAATDTTDVAKPSSDTTTPTASTGTAKTAAANSDSTADATAKTPAAKSSRKKKHSKSETAETTPPTASEKTDAPAGKTGTAAAKTETTPASTPAVTPATVPTTTTTTNAASATGPAGAAGTPKADVAKGSHRRHHGKGKASEEEAAKTKATPNPPIVVTPSTVPLQDQHTPMTNVAPVTPATLPAGTFGPTVQTGLPVARPGAGTTATLPTDLVPNKTSAATLKKHHVVTPAVATFPFTDYAPAVRKPPTHTYPWKSNIITTVFWIGEGSTTLSSTNNYQSAWNSQWIRDNGGIDSQDDMSGYAPAAHASTLNPFYIALPFNDLAYPDKARRWLPAGWSRPPRDGKQVSACQDRWIEIKARNGRICFAQWEDVGPLRYDHAEYVFGDERPNTLTHAGLDISPAVALYLGIDRHGSGLTAWRFVDDADVLPGMWLKYDEQALLFKELKERARHPKPNPRIQDLAEPTPDDSSQDANQRKAGAARG